MVGRQVAVTVARYCTPLMVGRLMEVEVVLKDRMPDLLEAMKCANAAPQGVCTFHCVFAMTLTGNTSTM